MNKYQEAINRIMALANTEIKKIVGYQTLKEKGFYKDLDTLQELIDKHKYKKVFTKKAFMKDCKEKGISRRMSEEALDVWVNCCVIPTEQFLACFSHVEKENV